MVGYIEEEDEEDEEGEEGKDGEGGDMREVYGRDKGSIFNRGPVLLAKGRVTIGPDKLVRVVRRTEPRGTADANDGPGSVVLRLRKTTYQVHLV